MESLNIGAPRTTEEVADSDSSDSIRSISSNSAHSAQQISATDTTLEADRDHMPLASPATSDPATTDDAAVQEDTDHSLRVKVDPTVDSEDEDPEPQGGAVL
ncbi:hypothetical protein PG994_006944 [Apiospora phragmitis]|uniref:Uncharacterized protein n=1 Tax=Apiospora phragmitis TaxID=2905665 RepID=A0ABR1VGL8_9PEZI